MKRVPTEFLVSWHEDHGPCSHRHNTEKQAQACAAFRGEAQVMMYSKIVVFTVRKAKALEGQPPELIPDSRRTT